MRPAPCIKPRWPPWSEAERARLGRSSVLTAGALEKIHVNGIFEVAAPEDGCTPSMSFLTGS